jgi:hypothetical protein
MKWTPLAALATIAAAVALGAPAASVGDVVPQTYAPRDCTTPKIEPKSITLTCGDAGAVLKHLRWKNWFEPVVKGEGDLYLKNCDPNCVEGGVDRYRVKVKLSDVETVQCANQTLDMYQKARVRYLGDAPPHANSLRNFDVACVS